MRNILFAIWLIIFGAAPALSFDASEFRSDYRSPYSIRYDLPVDELLAPDQAAPRRDFKKESSTPYHAWYSCETLRRYRAWGPEPNHYPLISGYETYSRAWKRQRLIAVAQGLIGLPYQHHHIPDWDPPASWPWKPVAYGRNSKGMDCSNFTSWVYNYGLGLKLNSAIRKQAYSSSASSRDGNVVLNIEKIYDDYGYASLIRKLETGDLLYIRHKGGSRISHVIMWVGEYGSAPDNLPLVIDCTGPEHADCNGNRIPIGVQLRPFTPDSWYYKSFDHANRVIAGDAIIP